MSTVMDNVAGKGRNIGTNVWVFALIASLVVFAGNTLYATTRRRAWAAPAPRLRTCR